MTNQEPGRRFGSAGSDWAGFMLMAALAIAPWLLGCRLPSLRVGLGMGLLLTAAGLLASAGPVAVKRYLPPLGLALFIIGYGWLAAMNPGTRYDPLTGSIVPLPHSIAWLPASADSAHTVRVMLEWTGPLLLVPAVAAWVSAADPRARAGVLLLVMACTGSVWTAFGAVLDLVHDPGWIAWIRSQPFHHGDPFATFDYHGHAGTFMLLTGPLMVVAVGRRALGHRDGRTEGAMGPAAGWWALLIGMVSIWGASLLANSARTAMAIGVVQLMVLAVAVARGAWRPRGFMATNRRGAMFFVIGAAAMLLVLSASGPVSGSSGVRPPPAKNALERMEGLLADVNYRWHPRWLESEAAIESLGRRPWFGYGPGGYPLLAPTCRYGWEYFNPKFFPGQPFDVMSHMMTDALQLLWEWGAVGFGAMTVLTMGGLIALVAGGRGEGWWALAIGLAMAGMLAHLTVDCSMQNPVLRMYFAVMLGLSWSASAWREPGTPQGVLRA